MDLKFDDDFGGNVTGPTRDSLLLSMASSNQARRKLKLTLLERCLESIAWNEDFFMERGKQISVLKNMVLDLKSRLLAELSRLCGAELRYPAGQHRLALVELLINKRLEHFDFAVMGDRFTKASTQQIWQCLAEKSGPWLRSVRDLRVKTEAFLPGPRQPKVKVLRTLAWCLPYLAKMPQLKELRITTLCCLSDELTQLFKIVPGLRRLQLLVHNSFELDVDHPIYVETLEELVLDGFKGGVVQPVLPDLLFNMQHLKINCVRCDELYPLSDPIQHTKEEEEWILKSYSLEHCSIILSPEPDDRFIYGNFPAVRHLMLTDPDSSKPSDRLFFNYVPLINQLETLYLRNFKPTRLWQMLHLLNSDNITTLILEPEHQPPMKSIINPFVVLSACKNLASLTVHRGALQLRYVGPDPHLHPPYDFGHELLARGILKNSLLKKIVFKECLSLHPGCLNLLLATSPLLEELVLDTITEYSTNDVFRSLCLKVKSGSIYLEHLRTFTLILDHNVIMSWNAFCFAKEVFARCPNICEATVELEGVDMRRLDPFLDIVNV